MSRNYTLSEKINALDALAAASVVAGDPGAVDAVSGRLGIHRDSLLRWLNQEQALRQQAADVALMRAQHKLAEAALLLASAIDADQIDGAPLNQITSALGAVIDRYLKLDDYAHGHSADQRAERIIRFEFRHPDGTLRSTPPWAADDQAASGTLQGGGLRAALRQDAAGADHAAGEGAVSGHDDLVAGPDLQHGQPGLARPESQPDAERSDAERAEPRPDEHHRRLWREDWADGRDWYQD